MGAVPDRAGPGTLRAGGGVTAPAPAAGHLVLVVLGDPHRHLRDLVLLIAVDHTQICGVGQVSAAVAVAGRESVAPLVRVIGPGRCDPGARGCLPRARAGPDPRLGFPGAGGLPGSSSREGGLEELPELRDSRCSNRANLAARASLGLHQIRELSGHARDLPIPRRELLGLLGQLPGLAPHDEEQLVARHLLRPGHRKIEPHTSRSIPQRHARNIRHPSISARTTPSATERPGHRDG